MPSTTGTGFPLPLRHLQLLEMALSKGKKGETPWATVGPTQSRFLQDPAGAAAPGTYIPQSYTLISQPHASSAAGSAQAGSSRDKDSVLV